MPLPLLLLLGSGAVAAVARGASWLAERRVSEINSLMLAEEFRASQTNANYGTQRLYWRSEFERRRASVVETYEIFLRKNLVSASDLDTWTADAWLQERIGELVVGRPLLIQPNFDQPASLNQMNGYRAYISGRNLSQTNPTLGAAYQNAGVVVAAGSYVSQQTDLVTEANKYVASVRVYLAALGRTIDGFDARFKAEVESDCRNVVRLEQLLRELDRNGHGAQHTKSVGIVLNTLRGYLGGLIEKYS